MKRYEYRLEYIKFTARRRQEQLLEAVNKFGKDGWRLNRMWGEVSLKSLRSLGGGVNLMLEREAES
jgi:hypothetical protein